MKDETARKERIDDSMTIHEISMVAHRILNHLKEFTPLQAVGDILGRNHCMSPVEIIMVANGVAHIETMVSTMQAAVDFLQHKSSEKQAKKTSKDK